MEKREKRLADAHAAREKAINEYIDILTPICINMGDIFPEDIEDLIYPHRKIFTKKERAYIIKQVYEACGYVLP